MSKYIRKTEDEWQIWQNTQWGGWEEITCETSWSQARQRIKEYRENAPGEYKLKKVRVKIVPPAPEENPAYSVA